MGVFPYFLIEQGDRSSQQGSQQRKLFPIAETTIITRCNTRPKPAVPVRFVQQEQWKKCKDLLAYVKSCGVGGNRWMLSSQIQS